MPTVAVVGILKVLAIRWKILKRLQIFETIYGIIFLKTVTDSLILIDKDIILSSITLAGMAVSAAFIQNKFVYLRTFIVIV